MADWVLSDCGLRPLPRINAKSRTFQAFLNSNRSKVRISRTSIRNDSLFTLKSGIRERNWGLKVSAPLRIQPVEENKEKGRTLNGDESFDYAAPPPFKLSDIKAAIPNNCWVKDSWKSLSYVVRDVLVVFGSAAVAAYFNNWVVWFLYWFDQGTMFLALFVHGHDY